MSDYVLLNLLNKFGKEIKCEVSQAFYYFFAMGLIKLNEKVGQILDSTYHMTQKILLNCVLGVKTLVVMYTRR